MILASFDAFDISSTPIFLSGLGNINMDAVSDRMVFSAGLSSGVTPFWVSFSTYLTSPSTGLGHISDRANYGHGLDPLF